MEIKDYNRRLVRPGAWASIGKGKVSIDFDALALDIESIHRRIDTLAESQVVVANNVVAYGPRLAKLELKWYRRLLMKLFPDMRRKWRLH